MIWNHLKETPTNLFKIILKKLYLNLSKIETLLNHLLKSKNAENMHFDLKTLIFATLKYINNS
jgi:predicted transcriptional regulator